MTTRITLNPISTIHASQKPGLPTASQPHRQVVPIEEATAVVSQSYQPGYAQSQTGPVIIDARPIHVHSGVDTLSHYLRVGRQYHPLCRNAFMERRVIGYYHYERRVEFSTCAVAAAYAGAFGPKSVEQQGFSYSMALWRLSQKVGYDLNTLQVYGPTGRCQTIAREMIQLVDKENWSREGVAEWLESLRL